MSTITDERKQPPPPPKADKRRRRKRARSAKVDMDLTAVDPSPASVEKRRELQSSPGAPGVPVVTNPGGSKEGETSAASDDEDETAFDIIWAVDDSMVLDVAHDEQTGLVRVDRLWALATEREVDH